MRFKVKFYISLLVQFIVMTILLLMVVYTLRRYKEFKDNCYFK